jgi:glycosyltransferase involved in cell wall biosynthesis
VIGGAESYALNVSHGLKKLGHEVLVVTDRVAGEPMEAHIDGISVFRLSEYLDRFNAPDRILWEEMVFGLRPELSHIADRFSPDILISNSLDLCFLAKTCSVSKCVPWIATFHEQAPERDPFGLATMRLCYGLLEPDAVIAGSRFYFDRALQFASAKICHLIHHGIDVDQFRPMDTHSEVRARYGFTSDDLVMVSVGRFKARKGFLDLIEAFSYVSQRVPSTVLVIAGSLNSASADYFDSMRSLIQKFGLESKVRLEDSVSHEQVAWLLSGCDIVIQASYEEGLGLAVLEAMACERPVIATSIPGHREITEGNKVAVTVEPADPGSLGHAILSLIADDAGRRRLGKSARRHVVRSFSLEAMASKTDRLLQNTITLRSKDETS